VDTQSVSRDAGLPAWDLYMHLARLIPDLPAKPVTRGFTYERHAMVPIKSDRGRVPCDMYRQYTIERISPGNDTAVIAWRFNYASMKPAFDSASVLEVIPVEGRGSGTAVIDVKGKCIVSAEVEFETPVVALGVTRVNWKEKASLKFRQAK
jgi:hypothetical protein